MVDHLALVDLEPQEIGVDLELDGAVEHGCLNGERRIGVEQVYEALAQRGIGQKAHVGLLGGGETRRWLMYCLPCLADRPGDGPERRPG